MPTFIDFVNFFNRNFFTLLIGVLILIVLFKEICYRMDAKDDECPICGDINLLYYYKGEKICLKCMKSIEKNDKHKKKLVRSLVLEKKYRKSNDKIGSEEWKKHLGIYGVHTKEEKDVFIKVVGEINNR